MGNNKKQIWTIGHSTRDWDEFLELLQSFSIETVADVRSYPGSRKFPQYNKENLEIKLPENNISYTHFKGLGGRRKSNPDSENTVWRHPSFRSYADYMETPDFKEAVKKLEQLASKKRVAYMCSEAVWWRCHRSMISDYLKVEGWEVLHIMDIDKATEHPFTAPAKVVDG
ncbi:MAG TPA: DUF488 domain-containing protein, partial [Salinimicrobium sp.]|nr:DUF488 domain-containing protein [Salinimicrobium sp.]